MATEESDNPDLRDRGYIYWRLLSSDPEAARAVILSEKPEIGDDTCVIESSLLDDLISQISSLASVYHKPSEAFVTKTMVVQPDEEDDEIEEEPVDYDNYAPSSGASSAPKSDGGNLLDLLEDSPPAFSSNVSSAPKSNVVKNQLVNAEVGHGVFISGAMIKLPDGTISLEFDIGNTSSTPVSQLAIQFNKNTFGLSPKNPTITLPSPVANGSVQSTSLHLAATPQMLNPQDVNLNLQAAIKNIATGTVFYFVIPIALEALFVSGVTMDTPTLVNSWKGMNESLESSILVNDLPTVDLEVIKAKLNAKDVTFIVNRDLPAEQTSVLYFICRTITNATFLVELKFKAGMNISKVTVKSPSVPHSDLCKTAIAKIIK